MRTANFAQIPYAGAMIVRETTGGLLLIDQYTHSKLSGEMARRIGNALFASPLPFEPVVMAIGEHDCGWPTQDCRPVLNKHGVPAHVFEVDQAIALEAWGASVEQVMQRDSYACLLVSLHAMALANHASLRQPDGPDEFSRGQAFRLRRFVHRQIELQESLRKTLGLRTNAPLRGGLAEPGLCPEEDLLRANFYAMQFLDQVSLNVCFDQLIFDRLDSFYARPGEQPIKVRLGRQADGSLRIDPWPFNSRRVELTAAVRRIKAVTYRDAEELRKACDAAEPAEIRIALCA